MKNFEFINWSWILFDGFYESNLFNSDTEYYINENLQDSEHPEVYEVEWDSYKEECGKMHADVLHETCVNTDGVIQNIDYKGISSPQYYNYETDKLLLSIDFDDNKLLEYIKDNKDDFNYYLHKSFTSYDGFISFVENNYNSFMDKFNNNEDVQLSLQVMLEYYMLRCIFETTLEKATDNKNGIHPTDTDYKQKVYELNQEILYNNLKVVESIS